MRPIIEVPCTTAQLISATAYNQVARCNMLRAELPPKLRANLLYSRALMKPFMQEGKGQNDTNWDQYNEPKCW
jgi:hypothetical protein